MMAILRASLYKMRKDIAPACSQLDISLKFPSVKRHFTIQSLLKPVSLLVLISFFTYYMYCLTKFKGKINRRALTSQWN